MNIIIHFLIDIFLFVRLFANFQYTCLNNVIPIKLQYLGYVKEK